MYQSGEIMGLRHNSGIDIDCRLLTCFHAFPSFRIKISDSANSPLFPHDLPNAAITIACMQAIFLKGGKHWNGQ